MPRHSLSIAPCPVYAAHDPTPRGERGCEHCGHRVHDLSAMEERHVRRLLREPHERLCVHARVRRDGSLVSALARLPLGLALGLTAVVACTPHGRDLELSLPGSLCEDEDGFEIPCESELDAWLRTIPEASPSTTPEVQHDPSEPVGASEPEGDGRAAEYDQDEYELLGFVGEVSLSPATEAEQEAERERRRDLERRATAAARDDALAEREHAG